MQAAGHNKLHGTGSLVPALAKNARAGHPQFRNGRGKHRTPGHPANPLGDPYNPIGMDQNGFTFTAHIDSAFGFNPIGFVWHEVVDVILKRNHGC
jgi:hypothetical protein